MEILQQCQKWNENNEYQKIIDALEAIPNEERTPEMDSELARAYSNLAEPEDRELLKKAITLLKPHEEYFADDHCWNFRMGYSYYYLDQERRALGYFEKALEARPGDEDTQEFIDWCRRRISLPEEQMTLKISYEPTEDDPEEDSIGMDDASWHMKSIEKKELDIDPVNAYNHMAIYLRWCMEHDLMGDRFLTEYGEVVKQVKAEPDGTDLRGFLREELLGCLYSGLFNEQGRAFAAYYYGENAAPYYPGDIDNYALEYFGSERYHSDEFRDEACLFIPFDDSLP